MNKYQRLSTDVYSIFGTESWIAEGLVAFPDDFEKKTGQKEFIRVSVVPSGQGLNRESAAGILLIEIFYEFGHGPRRGFQLADILDRYLVNKSRSSITGKVIQFSNSSVQPLGQDTRNPDLSRMQYTIPFNFFGVL
jgi:hypothetical protein